MNLGYFKGIKQNLRTFSTSYAVFKSKNHYDSLGITPKATQSEVKNAYYKLSMQYHPDRNEGSEAAAKQFRDITSAYEVLGNVKMRRLYDKGLYGGGVSDSSTHEPDPKMGFYKSRERRTRPPPPDGRTPIYDFDEWSKQHYGATFAKDIQRKQKIIRNTRVELKYQENKRLEKMIFVILCTLCLLMYMTDLRDYDTVVTKEVKKT